MADAAPPEEAAASGRSPADAKLDELMLAMDVVDTLRHQEGLAEKELGQDERDVALKARLKALYEGQGLEVSDRILEEGIKALKESRFVYTPPPPSLSRSLALLWVRRRRYGAVVGLLALAAVAVVGWRVWEGRAERAAQEQARTELTVDLPRRLAAAADATRREAAVDDARRQADQLLADGEGALKAGSAEGARRAIAGLEALRGRLLQQYRLRIVSRPGEQTGVFRIPDINEASRNYYVIVEAVAPDGSLLSLPVTSEENGRTASVTKWGVRVPAATFNAVRRDKEDDGIVENNILGEKKRGALDPVFTMRVQGGAITEW
jgi:hypothetical protein